MRLARASTAVWLIPAVAICFGCSAGTIDVPDRETPAEGTDERGTIETSQLSLFVNASEPSDMTRLTSAVVTIRQIWIRPDHVLLAKSTAGDASEAADSVADDASSAGTAQMPTSALAKAVDEASGRVLQQARPALIGEAENEAQLATEEAATEAADSTISEPQGADHAARAAEEAARRSAEEARARNVREEILTQQAADQAAREAAHGGIAHAVGKIRDGRVNLLGSPVTVDLFDLVDNPKVVLGGLEIPAGGYEEMRVVISGSYIEVAGDGVYATEGYDVPADKQVVGLLQMPSAAQSGLKIDLAFRSNAGGHAVLRLDFDIDNSFGELRGMSRIWVLNPVIRVEDDADDATDDAFPIALPHR